MMKSLFPLKSIIVSITATVLLGLTAVQAEEPVGYLHCSGQTADHKRTEHTITIYSKTATMDLDKYELYSDDAHYALQADKPPLGGPVEHWFVIVAINRVTGSYEISDGRTVVQQVKTETGTCVKTDGKL